MDRSRAELEALLEASDRAAGYLAAENERLIVDREFLAARNVKMRKELEALRESVNFYRENDRYFDWESWALESDDED